jgi:hypothetical protein
MSQPARKPYPSDVTDEEWASVAPYLTLMTYEKSVADALRRQFSNDELSGWLEPILQVMME